MTHRIVTLPGDGIGPEIMAPALRLLEAVGEFEFEEHLFGGASIDAHGTALTDEVAGRLPQRGRGAAGGRRRTEVGHAPIPQAPRPEQGLLGLRKGLGLYANLRPVKPLPALYDASPLRGSGSRAPTCWSCASSPAGSTSARRPAPRTAARDVCAYTTAEIERIARTAFGAARAKVTSVDKANVLETSRLWREVVSDLHSREFPHIAARARARRQRRDAAGRAPRHFDVILTENMFGDILTDEAAMITGSIGMLPSASLGGDGPGLFEPVHGSAPDIAGTGRGQPAGDVPVGRDDAAPRARFGTRRRR